MQLHPFLRSLSIWPTKELQVRQALPPSWYVTLYVFAGQVSEQAPYVKKFWQGSHIFDMLIPMVK